MTTERTLLTAEELFRLPSGCGRYELIHGELREMSPAGGRHNQIIGTSTHLLITHVEANKLGVVLAGDTGIFLARNPDHIRAPDVCFIAAERLPAGGVPSGFLEIVPDLVVEVVSPGDTAAEVQAKTEEWLRAGARLVWTLYPETRSVAAATSLAETRIYHEGELLSGEPVLPDFSVPVAALFA